MYDFPERVEKNLMASIENYSKKPAIAITMGDPCGIGPEVVAKAMADSRVYETCRPLVVGSVYSMEQAVFLTGVSLNIKKPPTRPRREWIRES